MKNKQITAQNIKENASEFIECCSMQVIFHVFLVVFE